jgi:hypothetical protein
MEIRIRAFSAWFILYFLFTQFNRDLQYYVLNIEMRWWWESPFDILLSGLLSFYLQSLLAYLLILLTYPKYGLWRSLAFLTLLFPILIATRYFIQEIVAKSITGHGNYHPDTDLKSYFIDNIYFSSIYLFFSVMYFFVRYTKHQEREKTALVQLQYSAELGFLRSQINPHFLFNSLNTTYSLVHSHSDKALRSIELLSHLTRRMLYEQKDYNPLDSELESLKEYIELQKLRFDPECFIELKTQVVPGILIPGQILIPLAENAFKHGNFSDKLNPVQINIHVDNAYTIIQFRNLKNHQQQHTQGGVGLNNVKRRLELLFGKNHSFSINNTTDTFAVNIKIPSNAGL